MIAKLRCTIDSVGDDWVIWMCRGSAISCPVRRRPLARLEKPGAPAAFHTEMRMRDEVPHLYGFVERTELDWFRTLTTVQGVGAKVALNILSVLAPDALAMALASGDKAAVGAGRRRGPQTGGADRGGTEGQGADRIAQGRSGPVGTPARHKLPHPNPMPRAVSALVNLGYGRADAFAAVRAVDAPGQNLE